MANGYFRIFKNKQAPYPSEMLPGVNYNKLRDDLFGNMVVDLEFDAMANLASFLEGLNDTLPCEKKCQASDNMIAYLCTYLDFLAAAGLGRKTAQDLQPSMKDLIRTHAFKANRIFLKYGIHATTTPGENLPGWQEESFGSIVVQTLRLGRVIREILNQPEAENSAIPSKGASGQSLVFKLLAKKTDSDICSWKDSFFKADSVLYAVNQTAMQIGWLMGYFAFLDNKDPAYYLELTV